MGSDPTHPPTQISAAESQPAEPRRWRVDVMAWAKAQGFRPLPGREKAAETTAAEPPEILPPAQPPFRPR